MCSINAESTLTADSLIGDTCWRPACIDRALRAVDRKICSGNAFFLVLTGRPSMIVR